MSETDASIAPDILVPYFERFAQGGGPESEFVRGLAIIHRWEEGEAVKPRPRP